MTGCLWAVLVYTYSAGVIVTENAQRFVRWVVA